MIKLSKLYLESEDIGNASQLIEHSSQYLTDEVNKITKLEHQICFARIMDFNHKFQKASMLYLSIFNETIQNSMIVEYYLT